LGLAPVEAEVTDWGGWLAGAGRPVEAPWPGGSPRRVWRAAEDGV